MSKIPVMPIGGGTGGIRWEKLLEIPVKLTMNRNTGQSDQPRYTLPTRRWDIVQLVSEATIAVTGYEERTSVYLYALVSGNNFHLVGASPISGQTLTYSEPRHITFRSGDENAYWIGGSQYQLSGTDIVVYLSGTRSAYATATGTIKVYGGTFEF